MPLTKSTIATVGSGVMAEAMIAGLLRGKQVAPNRIIATHPRADRRSELISSYGISTVEDNATAVEKADVVVLAIKPQMLARVGKEIAPALKRGKLVISIIAGATTAALSNALGHDQIVRSMPNTPAQLGRGMTVWYAMPRVTRAQKDQARVLLGSLGVQLEVDDESSLRWPPRSAAPARPTSFWSWRRSSTRPSTWASRATSPTTW
jgi:pyrroline-5-carboxylate reductase